MVTLMGTRKGVMTPVAIMRVPAGRADSMGWASRSYTDEANGARHRNATATASAARIRRVRSSMRCDMKVSLPSAPLLGLSDSLIAQAGFL